MRELLDVVDSFGNKTGIVKEKSKIKRDGDYHKAIAVLIMNNDGEILFQKRSSNKKMYPNLWSVFLTGHVKSNEESIDAAIREINEELGINIFSSELEYLYTIKDEKKQDKYIENLIFDIYILVKDIDINNIKLNDEVSNIQFLTKEEAEYLIESESKMIVPNYKNYELVFKYLNEKEKVKKYGRMGFIR